MAAADPLVRAKLGFPENGPVDMDSVIQTALELGEDVLNNDDPMIRILKGLPLEEPLIFSESHSRSMWSEVASLKREEPSIDMTPLKQEPIVKPVMDPESESDDHISDRFTQTKLLEYGVEYTRSHSKFTDDKQAGISMDSLHYTASNFIHCEYTMVDRDYPQDFYGCRWNGRYKARLSKRWHRKWNRLREYDLVVTGFNQQELEADR